MSIIEFMVDSENNLTAEGNFANISNRIQPPSVSGCIRYSVKYYKLIEENYIHAIINDGRIIGTERTDILEQVDLFLNSLILLWVLIGNSSSRNIIVIENRMRDTMINISVNNDSWTAAGHVSAEMSSKSGNLNTALREKVIPGLKKFFSTYSQSAEDGIIDDTERDSLKKDLAEILYYTIYLRFQISYCIIDG